MAKPVYAVAPGTVIYTNTGCPNGSAPECGSEFGNWIAIKHNDGMVSIYGHLTTVSVRLNQVITRCVSGPGGYQIGTSGNSGKSFGPHLHFELQRKRKQIAPSYDPFAGSYSQSLEYWYRYALVNDPLHSGRTMHYPATTCQ